MKSKALASVPEVLPAVSEDLTLANQALVAIQAFGLSVRQFFTTAAVLEKKAQATLMAARTLSAPKDSGADAVIQTFIRRASAEKKAIEEHWAITAVVYNFQRWLVAGRKRGTDALDTAATIAQQHHNAYVAAENARVAREQEAARVAAEAKARAERQAELDALEAQALEVESSLEGLSVREQGYVDGILSGQTEWRAASAAGYKNAPQAAQRLRNTPKIVAAIQAGLAAAALRQQAQAVSAAPLDVQVETVTADIQKAGVDRTTWRGECFDEAALIAAVIKGDVPSDVLMVNQAKLTEYARSLRLNLNRWPGCKAISSTKTV